MLTVKDRVARGAAWLDEHYPNWYQKIDLGILDIADCHQCVLGQVYSGVIPVEERGQILAQVIENYAKATSRARSYWADTISTWGGYSILSDFHQFEEYGTFHGFLALRTLSGEESESDYLALLDEWTRVIIERRLADHPDLVELTCRLDEMRVPAAVA